MQGAMFLAAQPWPIVTAAADRQLATFGPPQPGTTPDPDTWMARLGELPLLAQPGGRWLYQSGSQVLRVLAARVAGAPFGDVLRERVLGPLGMNDTGFHATDTGRLATAYGRYTWDGGFGTTWSNVPSQDLTVVVLTQRAADENGMPAVCDDVLKVARGR
jgi:CubicO group peptidase (beta-lactamase class C family)